MRDRVRAWTFTTARVIAAASGLAVLLTAQAFADYPLQLPVTGFLLVLAGGVAAFGAHWRVPARALYFVGPLGLPALVFVLARASLDAAFTLAGVQAPSADLVVTRLAPQLLIVFPGVLAGTAAAALAFER